MASQFTGLTLVEVGDDETDDIVARLKEFVSNLGVKVAQVFMISGQRQGIVAYVIATNQKAYREFQEVVASYAGVKSCRDLG